MSAAGYQRFLSGIILMLSLIPLSLFGQQVHYSRSTVIEKTGGRDFIVHPVEKGQTLYSISRLYEVSIDSLYQYNEALKDGTRTGMLIRVPLPVQPSASQPQGTQQKKPAPDTLPSRPSGASCEPGNHPGPYNLALVLPMYLNEIDSIPSFVVPDATIDEFRSLRFLQFYEGAMMAIDSLVNAGLSVNVHVYDIDEDTMKIKRLLKDPVMKEMNLIIGLLYGPGFSRLADFGKANRIPVVNPLSNKRQFIDNNEWVFLANSTVVTMARQIAAFLCEGYGDQLIILLNSGKETEKRSMGMIRDELVKEFTRTDKDIKNIYMFSGNQEIGKIPVVLAATGKSAIIILSNDELFVANAMRYLREWSSTHSLMVFGMPGWLEFKSLESRNLVDLNFHSFGNTFVDYTRPDVKDFVFRFREKYKTEPQELAFQGYDVSWYFLNCLYSYGPAFMECTETCYHKGLQTRYRFMRKDHQGFENTWLNIYKIENYQVIDARD